MAQMLLHGVIEANIMEADLSVTSDGRLRPTKKVSASLLVHCLPLSAYHHLNLLWVLQTTKSLN
jgi:hypothetical protein